MRNSLLNNTVVTVMLVMAIILPRVLTLDRFTTADEKRWLSNVSIFTHNLSLLNFNDLLQQPHPGITQQWLGALTIHSDSWAVRKLPLAIGQSILIGIISYVFWRLWGKMPALLLTALLALNPFLIAHTRVYAMDSLLALFCLLSLGLLLLWDKTGEKRYLAASGAAAALAVLSKLPGILLVPFCVGYLLFFSLAFTKLTPALSFVRRGGKFVVIFISAFLITSILILPSLLTNTIPVLQNIFSFFSSDDYETLHQASRWYYVGTFLFFSTPLHLLAVLALPFLLWKQTSGSIPRRHILTLLIFTGLFFVMMTLGEKKGDRYILPVFLMLDAIVVAIFSRLISLPKKNVAASAIAILALGIVWQAADVVRLHPYTLAYVNPLTKPFFAERRLGWGEGLDIAAEYLNRKPDAENLKVAAYYPNEFSYRFKGETIPLHQYDSGTVDYAVLYRAMYERDPDGWETDVLSQFKNKKPEKIIKINGLDYVWIYPL